MTDFDNDGTEDNDTSAAVVALVGGAVVTLIAAIIYAMPVVVSVVARWIEG